MTAKGFPTRSTSRAFTLLELLAVLTLVSFAAVLAAGSLVGRFEGIALRKSCGLVAAAARQGRLLAMEGGRPCRLVFDIDAQTVQLAFLGDSLMNGEATAESSEFNRNPYQQPQHLANKVRILRIGVGTQIHQGGRVEIDIDRLGESEPLEVELAVGARVRTVVLPAYGGEVRVVAAGLSDWRASRYPDEVIVTEEGYD